jgi:diguanylate cyclase (GGDEF)-like protein/PAS domain S-box-containing protein
LDHAPAGCFEANADGMVTFVNQQWTELTGVSAADALDGGWSEAVHLEDRDRVVKNWYDTIKRGQPFAMEYRVASVDRVSRWLAVSAQPLMGDAGTVEGYLGWVSDVTKKVELEEYLERALMDQVKVSERARRQEERFRLIVENTSEGIWRLGRDHRTLFGNARMAELLGCAVRELEGVSLLDFLPPGAADEFADRLRASAPGDRVLHEVDLQRKDGTELAVMIAAAVLGDAKGDYDGALVVVTDLSELRQATAMLHTVERQFQTVFERAPLGISIVGLDALITEVNDAFCLMSGYDREELVGQPSMLLMSDEDAAMTTKVVTEALVENQRSHVSVEHRLVRADGTVRWVLSDTSIVHGDDGTPLFTVTLTADVTERKLFEEHLAHEASHDPLTGLPNRAMLRELLEQAAARTHRHEGTLAVMFVDLDHFKQVNDVLGHAAGDDVLIEAANRIRSSLRLGDVVARYGGDEFVVLCEDAGEEAGSLTIADRIRETMNTPFIIDGIVTGVGASVGIALSDGSDDIDVLLECADKALYQAKRGGRDRSIIHDRACSAAESLH